MKKDKYKVIITGGAGFIGGTLIRKLLKEKDWVIYNLDRMGYASDLSWVKDSKDYKLRHLFLKIDLREKEKLEKLVKDISPNLIIHLAAESHVDRSIDNPVNFIESNIVGTFNLLEASRSYWKEISSHKKKLFRFIHISTDEVFGSLGVDGKFDENTKYSPRSPYSSSKASSDHLVQSWYHTYGLPTIISNCSNNFGPYQFPEKLIPLSILKGIKGENIPLYGNGINIRDWLYVEDHVEALLLIADQGKAGKSYCIGGFGERTNKEVQLQICNILDKVNPRDFPHSTLIKNVADRPGHDKRYAINSKLIQKELGWAPKITFEDGLKKTIHWYLNNLKWSYSVMQKSGYSGYRIGNKK
tara:strand:+ start:474 stop:1544 length:1071 start_codon:yes stop_codon:yes gene_type:complete